jgi:DNA-binding NarL/FixJ family response regulator
VIRVVVVEDNDVFRDALGIVLDLAPDLEVAGTAPDGTTALALCERACPDVVVVDYRLPDLDGVEVTSGILRTCPGAAVLALTAAADAPEVEALLAAGAVGCLAKSQELGEIVGAIRDAGQHAGGR